MRINSISAVNYNTKAQSLSTNPQNFGSAKNVVYKAGNTMKALAAAAILGMASVGMSSCVQPNDPTPYEIPEETPTEETPVVDEGETKPTDETPTIPVEEEPTTPTEEETTKPVVEEPTTPTEEGSTTPVVEEPTTPVETPAEDADIQAVKNSNLYKILSGFGFDVKVERVPQIDGQYLPKAGEITEFGFTNNNNEITYTLDRENSTEDNLLYTAEAYFSISDKTYFEYLAQLEINKEEKSLDIYGGYNRFKLNDNGGIDLICPYVDDDDSIMYYETLQLTVGDNNVLYDENSKEFMSNVKFTLATGTTTKESTTDEESAKKIN